MATVTDRLITVLSLVGAREYAHAMHNAETAVKSFATTSKEAAIGGKGGAGTTGGGAAAGGGQRGIAGAFTALTGGITAAEGAMVGLVAIAGLSVRAFAETEKSVFSASLVLRNLGSKLPIAEVQQFAAEQQRLTGVNNAQIVATVGLLERYGVTDSQVKGLTKTVQDFAAGAQIPLEDASIAVGEAILGNTGRLKTLGVSVKATGDKTKNLIAVQKELNNLFAGGAEARRQTLAGSFEALGSALTSLLSAIGSKLATVLIPVVNALTTIVTFLSENVALATTIIGAAVGFFIGGPIGALIGGLAGLGLGLLPDRGNAAEGVGTGKGKLATEDTLQKIADNTSGLDDLVKSVFGEAGTAARTGFSLRDAKLAFNV